MDYMQEELLEAKCCIRAFEIALALIERELK